MKRKYLVLFSLSGLVLSLDQLTKFLARAHLGAGEIVETIPGYLSFSLTRNAGFAFGLLQRAPSSLQELFFIGIPVFALVLIVLIFIKLQDNQMGTSVALTSILAGAVGNLVDRLQFGYVIDFVHLGWPNGFQLPAFNLADGSIVLGVVLMFFNTLHQDKTAAA